MADAYAAGLALLARRELSEVQVRTGLARRRFDPADIDAAVVRLRQEMALDDRRTALACARSEAHRKHHGRLRALRQLEAIGIARDVARDAVAEVFADLDEDALIAQALDRRLRRGLSLDEDAAARRVHRYLLAQGFDAARVTAAVKNRMKTFVHDE
ncbi:MAG: RecX family transcriptional regulator [Acidobacteria bacterium]|nr:RecX family transcriptional regulator [Acidobacteriota bacterium]